MAGSKQAQKLNQLPHVMSEYQEALQGVFAGEYLQAFIKVFLISTVKSKDTANFHILQGKQESPTLGTLS